MASDDDTPARVRWARLRFQILGPVLAAPPGEGDLRPRLEELAARPWKHPTTGEAVRFAFKTLERWYYDSYKEADPLRALERKVPSHAGTHPAVPTALREAIGRQHKDHPRWSYQLHYDNLVALGREDPRLGPMPAYATVALGGEQLLDEAERGREEHGMAPLHECVAEGRSGVRLSTTREPCCRSTPPAAG
jgi:putative transposase